MNIDKQKAKLAGLSLVAINQSIASANIEFPTGKVKDLNEQMTVRLAGKYKTVSELQNLVLGSNGSSTIKLKDVAEVYDGIKDQLTISRYNGINGIGLRIKKQSDANAVILSKLTQEKFKSLEKKYKKEGLKFEVAT